MAKFAGFHAWGMETPDTPKFGASAQLNFDPPVSGIFSCAVFFLDVQWVQTPNWQGVSPHTFDVYISEVNGQKFDSTSPGMGGTVRLEDVRTITATVKASACNVRGTLLGPL